MYTVAIPDSVDVLTLAKELLDAPLPHEWADECDNDLGPYCLRCAAARATTTLSRRHKLPAGFTDGALEVAVLYVRMAEPGRGKVLSRDEAIAAIDAAIEHARK